MTRRRLRDYYRQFEALSPQEASDRLVARRRAEQSAALVARPDLDLATTTWHEAPDPELVNAATFALRGALHRYPPTGPDSPAVRALAAHHGVPPEHVVLGHGAGQLLQAALRELGGGEVLLPWPAWAPLPALMRRAGVEPVPVPLTTAGAPDPDALRAAVTPATRALLVCSPNDPTGALADLAALPPGLPVLVDEALVELAPDGSTALGRPDTIVFRSFSKAWALAGLRAGYAIGPGVARLEPGQGVAAPIQAAVAAALEDPDRATAMLRRRRAAIATERERLTAGLAGTPFACAPSAAHVVWLSGAGMTGAQLAAGLAGQGVRVATGWDDDRHVRVTLRDAAATERLLAALRALL